MRPLGGRFYRSDPAKLENSIRSGGASFAAGFRFQCAFKGRAVMMQAGGNKNGWPFGSNPCFIFVYLWPDIYEH